MHTGPFIGINNLIMTGFNKCIYIKCSSTLILTSPQSWYDNINFDIWKQNLHWPLFLSTIFLFSPLFNLTHWTFKIHHIVLFPSFRQQAFNATAVVRHMRRLQLGSSMGSSMDASNPPTRPSQAQKPVQPVQPVQAGQSQNSGQPVQSQAPGAAPGKSSTTDNNMAAPRKECEY